MTYNVLCKDGSGFFTNWEKENIYGDNMEIKDFMCSRCYKRFNIKEKDSERYELILRKVDYKNIEYVYPKRSEEEIANFCEDCGKEIEVYYK